MENKAADALSHSDEEIEEEVGSQTCTCRGVSVVEQLANGSEKDDRALSLFQQLQTKANTGPLSPARYKNIDRVWYYKDRVLLDPAS